LAYIFVAHNMGLSSFKFEQWAPKDASFLRQSAFLTTWSYLAPFLRYGDLLAENCLFFPPHYYSAPSLPMFPLEFRAEVNHEETRVVGLSSSEDPVIVA